MASWLESGGKRNFREMGDWMFEWNEKNGLCRYKFQYAAFLADLADWFPEFVNKESHFYYGTNAVECISYLIEGKKKSEALKFLPKLNSELMKISKTGIIKKQNASRNVSRITKKIALI